METTAMNGTSVIVDLPAGAYHPLEQQAKNTRRSIAAEARYPLRNLNEQNCDPERIFPEIAALRTWSDEELQAMVQRRLPVFRTSDWT